MNIEQKSNTAQFRKALEGLLKREVLVGIPAANAERADIDDKYASEVIAIYKRTYHMSLEEVEKLLDEKKEKKSVTNALLGYVHEYGSPAKNIPARPFLHPGVLAARSGIELHMKKAGQLALRGKPDEIAQELEKVGLIAAASVQKKITDGPFEPLKPATLAARRARGRTGDRPLIDTGQLRRAVTYVVR